MIVMYILFMQADTVWTKTYGGNSNDRAFSVRVLPDGYIIGGETESYGEGEKDIYIIKTDFTGNLVWAETYGTELEENFGNFEPTTDNGHIIIGTTDEGAANGNSNILLIKIDENSNTTWSTTFGGDANDLGIDIKQLSNPGYIALGETFSSGEGRSDFYVARVDPTGHTLWTKTYGGEEEDRPHCIQITNDDGYIMIGETNSFGITKHDIYVVKIDGTGNTQWTKTYGNDNTYEEGNKIYQTRDGGYIIAGKSGSEGYILKTNNAGNVQWEHRYNLGTSCSIKDIKETIKETYIATGYVEDDLFVMSINNTGDTFWTRTYGNSQTEEKGWDVEFTGNGGCIIAGEKENSNYDMWVLRMEINSGIEEKEINEIPVRKTYICNKNSYLKITVDDNEKGIKIYNSAGKFIKKINTSNTQNKEVIWDFTDKNGNTVNNGIYFFFINPQLTKSYTKVILLK